MKTRCVTREELQKVVNTGEVEGFVKRAEASVDELFPGRPETPQGQPRDFTEALFYEGPCAIPLFSDGRWRFAIINDGMPIKNTSTDRFVMFDTHDEAMEQLLAWLESKK